MEIEAVNTPLFVNPDGVLDIDPGRLMSILYGYIPASVTPRANTEEIERLSADLRELRTELRLVEEQVCLTAARHAAEIVRKMAEENDLAHMDDAEFEEAFQKIIGCGGV